MPKTNKKYLLKLPSQTDNLEIIRDVVSKIAVKVGFEKDDVNKIELAVDEACANVIKHAYANDSNNLIEIAIQIDLKKMMVTVTDHGKGFEPEKVKLPNMEEYLKKFSKGGLGLFLIETLMDKVDFKIKPGTKNQVKMVKYLSKNEND
ncbi:MAG: ATP-binding protein [bacterium]